MGLFKNNQPKLLKVEVPEKNVKLRLTLVILLVALGVGMIAYAIHALVTKEPGWYTVELTEGHTELNDELIFNYCIGGGELSAADEYRKVSSLYAAEVSRAYRLFDVYRSYEGVVNLHTINQYPGEIWEVDPVLYEAFALMEKMGSRILYMGPVFSEYRNLFSSQSEVQAAQCDPHTDEETRLYLENVMSFISDPAMIHVELLGENRITLHVAEAYRSFLHENGVTDALDFGWLTNAFIVDHVAEVMISHGYTAGNITSYDGYTRNFDDSGEFYGFNIFDRVGKNVYPAAVAEYRGHISMVFLRDYPLGKQDMAVYYAYPDGRYATRYAHPGTGIYRSALHNLVSYAYDKGCAEVAIRMAEVFIAEELDEGKLDAMSRAQVYSIWCLDGTVCYNDEAMILSDLYTDETMSYQSACRAPLGQ